MVGSNSVGQNDQQNVYAYHEIFAKVMGEVFQAALQGDERLEKKMIIKATIFAAATKDRFLYSKDLEEKKIDELYHIWGVEWRKAGVIALQDTAPGMSYYSRILAYKAAAGKKDGSS